MAYYFGSGEGRCPSLSKTVTVTYTRDQLYELKSKIAQHEAAQAWAINLAASIMGPTFAKTITGVIATISTTVGINAIQNYLTSNSRLLADILEKNSGSSFRIKFNLGCMNQGSNGHYWAIKSASLA